MEDRAQVERSGVVALSGVTTVEVPGLPLVAVDRSLKVECAGGRVLGAKLLVAGWSPLGTTALLVLIGGLIGLFNGAIIAGFRMMPFIVTLGTMTFYRGLALSYTNGQPILSMPDGFKQALGGTVAGLPMPLVIAVLLVILGSLLLRYTKTGQYILAIGGNAEAVRLSGINVSRYTTLTYVISGVMAAVVALVLIAQLGAAEPILGNGWELNAIAAAVVGGASLSGGKGNIVGALLGALLLSMLQNVLTLLNVQAFYQMLATGLIIIGAMVIDRYTRGE